MENVNKQDRRQITGDIAHNAEGDVIAVHLIFDLRYRGVKGFRWASAASGAGDTGLGPAGVRRGGAAVAPRRVEREG